MRQWIAKYKSLSRIKKILFWSVSCFIAYLIIGFLIVPPIAKNIATKKLSEITGRDVILEKIRINPLILKLTVLGFSIKEKDPNIDFVSFSEFDVNLQASSLFRLAPVIKEVKLQTPFFRGVRHKDGSLNFTDIIEKNKAEAVPEEVEEDAEPFQFAIYNIEILDGQGEIVDETVDKTHRVSGLSLGIPFISNLEKQIDIFVQPYFKAKFNDTPVSLTGQTKPFHDTLETSLNIDLTKIDLPYYFAYVPMKTNIKLVSGSLDLKGQIYFLQKTNEPPTAASEGELTVNSLGIEDVEGNPILDLPKFYVKWGRSQVIKRDIHVEKIEINHPEVGITHREDSTVNLFSLVPAEAGKTSESAPTPDEAAAPEDFSFKLDDFKISEARVYLRDFYKAAGDKKPETSDIFNLAEFTIKDILLESNQHTVTVGEILTRGGDLTVRRQPSDEFNFQSVMPASGKEEENKPETAVSTGDASDNASPWTATLKTLSVDQFNVFGENLASKTEGNISINDIRVTGENISTQEESKGNVVLACKVNEKALVDIKTQVQLTPVAVSADMAVADINLPWLQPFIKDKLNLIIKNGRFAVNGNVAAALDEDANPDVSFKGDVVVDSLMVYDAAGKDKLVELEEFAVEKIDAGYPEIYANMAAIRLDKFNSRIIRKKDGSINLADIAVADEEKEQSAGDLEQGDDGSGAKAAEDILVTIGEFTIKDSEVDFIDRSLSPYFETALADMQVKIKGLSSKKDQRADVDISAKVDGHAPLKVSGKLNPLSRDIFADLDFDFKNMELSPVSPYSGKYVGNKIRKGKLSFDLAYLIEGSNLDASNKIFIDQIELGEKVDSPDATSLPVGLGIALLKDPSGRINLNIPVQGDLDDPEFSVGGTIVKVIVNLLVKAATSPFALLGSMFGGGEDINLVHFDPGMAILKDTENEKLDTVITAFTQRPALNLEIRGYTDLETDKKALVGVHFEQMLAAEKIKKTGQKDEDEAALEQVDLTPEEYEKYLEKVYKAVKKKLKKTDDFEEPDDVTAAFMEETVKSQIKITDEDLKLLASQRSLAVKDYLMGPEKIIAERIFLVEPDTLEPESAEGGVKSRAELGIQ